MNRATVTGAVAGALAIAGLATAYPSYSTYIPNGSSVLPGNSNSCQTCHVSTSGGSRNVFGQQTGAYKTSGVPDWSKFWNLDADGDGKNNGVELGDPTGVWRPGGTPATAPLSNPSNPNSLPSFIKPLTPAPWAVIKHMFG